MKLQKPGEPHPVPMSLLLSIPIHPCLLASLYSFLLCLPRIWHREWDGSQGLPSAR